MERRIHLRYKTDDKYWAKLTIEEEDKVKIRDISIGGISLHTTQDLPLKETFKIEIVSGNNEKIIPTCEVAWSTLLQTREEKDDFYSIYEVGLKFIELTDIQKIFLEKCISGSRTVSVTGI
jgi:c-di-GMP-binding flagellar brake protein YcgR